MRTRSTAGTCSAHTLCASSRPALRPSAPAKRDLGSQSRVFTACSVSIRYPLSPGGTKTDCADLQLHPWPAWGFRAATGAAARGTCSALDGNGTLGNRIQREHAPARCGSRDNTTPAKSLSLLGCRFCRGAPFRINLVPPPLTSIVNARSSASRLSHVEARRENSDARQGNSRERRVRTNARESHQHDPGR